MDYFRNTFSQTRTIQYRQSNDLHIINELQRCRLLLCCLFCSTGVSIVYTFELFTTEFSDRYGFSAGDLSTISTVGVAFCYFVVPYSFVYELMGPTPLLLFAVVTGFVGTLGLGLIFQNIITGNLLVICVFYAIMNTCAGLFDAASIVTLQQTFPRNRGPVLGLAKVMTGLGSSVLASISSNLFGTNVSGFLYFVMAFAMVVAFVSAFVLVLPPYVVNWWRGRRMTQAEKDAARSLVVVYNSKNMSMPRLILGYSIAISLILFFAISSPIVAYLGVSQQARYVIGAITCVLMCSYGAIALPLRCLGGVDEPSPDALHRAGEEAAAEDRATSISETEVTAAAAREDPMPPLRSHQLPSVPTADTMHSSATDEVRKPPPTRRIVQDVDEVEDEDSEEKEGAVADPYAAYMDPDAITYTDPKYPGTIWQALRHVDVYLIYLGFILQGAIGTIVMYNSSTIYVARTGKSRSTQLSALYTAFLGVGSSLGRIAIGVFEACVQRQPEGKRRLLVTLALPVPPLIGIVGGILILLLPGDALLLPYILIYFKEGAFYSTCAVVFPSLFRSHLSIYYNLSSATTVVCVICFNRFLFGYMVDKKRAQLKLTGDCTSRDCILIPIIVSICFCALAFLVLLVVHIRYARYVRQCEKKKLEDESYINLDDINAMPSDGEDVPDTLTATSGLPQSTGSSAASASSPAEVAADVTEVHVGPRSTLSPQK